MGHFKKEDEALQGQPDQELDQEYDHNLSTKHQLSAIREDVKMLRTHGRDTYTHPIKAWDEIINYIEVLLKQDRHQECGKGTVGCTTRHKHYDHCSDDPRYSN